MRRKWRINRVQREISPGYLIWEFYWWATNGERYWMGPDFDTIRRKVWEELRA
jgi:hypothetical protein